MRHKTINETNPYRDFLIRGGIVSLIIAVALAIFEIANMFILDNFVLPKYVNLLIEIGMLTVEMIPTLYFFVYKPMKFLLNKDLERTKQQKEQIFKVYSDVLYSASQGKINLWETDQIAPLNQEGELIGHIMLKRSEDVNNARELTTKILKKHHVEQKRSNHIILCVSEATTNVIKHAFYGHLEIRKLDNSYLRIFISDSGPGMDLQKLPNFLLLQGFSTKDSMGVGFTLMFKYAEKVYLAPWSHGTILALDFAI
ncbi:ATP-binding protein [Desulfitobacterium sp. Sab5]|uniref:ATP-binding protein n=1 Tax=Desulfitobacterium TaxID=36853 RepID=UPI003CF92D65